MIVSKAFRILTPLFLYRVLYDKRFSAFHYPVTDEDAPNYHAIITNPMDIATLLQRVDSGKYITCKSFVEDFDLILANAKVRLSVKLLNNAPNMLLHVEWIKCGYLMQKCFMAISALEVT